MGLGTSAKNGIANLGPLLTLLFSLLMLSITAWAYSKSEMLFNNFTLLSMLLASTLISLLTAIIGVFGQKKNEGLLMGLFLVLVIVCCGNYLFLTINAAKLGSTIFEGNCSSSQNSEVEIAHKSYEISFRTLCTISCPCSLDL